MMLSNFDLAEILQNNMRDPLTLADSTGTYVMVNQPAAKNMGMSPEDLIGTNARKLVEDGYVSACPTITALETKKTATLVFYARTGPAEDARQKPYFGTAVPFYTSDGTLAGILTSTCSADTMEEFLHKLQAEEQKRTLREDTLAYMLSVDRHTLIYTSSKMKILVNNCTKIAKTDGLVLLSGESGSGKDVLARYIHSVSGRSKHPFIPVNCAAVPHDLFESPF